MWLEFSILLTIAGYFFYRWAVANFHVFTERGVPHKTPLPLFGNGWRLLRMKGSMHKVLLDLYKETKQHKIFGYYNLRNPTFVINDPEIINMMAIADFDSFTNHQKFFTIEDDRILGSMLTMMRDQRWRNMRNSLTPVYTGSKMRAMFTLMGECFDESIDYLRNQVKNGQGVDVDLKDCFARLSNDVIATTAFGFKTNSYNDPDNEFYRFGRDLTKSNAQQAWKFILYSMSPKLFRMLGMKLMDTDKLNYFVRLVVDAMKYREEHNIHRPDMIQLMMGAQKESENNWSIEEIVAQCLIFFFAAFENNANFLCTTCQCLMETPEAQDKLYEEIMETNEKLEGKPLDYDTLSHMEYMDMVASESLRKYPLVPILDRECKKDYTARDGQGQIICKFKPGDRVWFQSIGLHWDEQYFPNPDAFMPERFSKENKHNIKPCTYTPFGIGLRNCIGNRYALMQGKAMLYYLLKEFKVERAPKSVKSLFDEMNGFQIAPKNGFWFKLVPRVKQATATKL